MGYYTVNYRTNVVIDCSWSYKGMFIHIGVGSALLVLLLVAMRRPRCAGQANDQFPRFFYAVTCSFVYLNSVREHRMI